MIAEIAPYKSQLAKTMDELLAVSEQNLFKGKPEGLLGDFIADIVLKKAREYCSEGVHSDMDSCKIDFCVLSNGELRHPLSKGNITRGNIFQMLPSENEMVILTLNGSEVKEFLEFAANKGGIPVADLRMKIKNNMPSEIMIGNETFNPLRSYTIITSYFLANGGDDMTFFTNAIRKVITGKKLRDAVIEYLQEENKKGNSIKVRSDGRIQYDK